MRIVHLEDLILEKGVDINSLLFGIHKVAFPVSVKWDGAPAFVAGKHLGQPFVAFKNGYHKKEPETFRDTKEIMDGISSPDLRRKMLALFQKMKHLETASIIEGDFIFDRLMIENGEFQPNTVRYKFATSQFDFWQLGVAIHTVDGKMTNFQDMALLRAGVFLVNVMPTITYESPQIAVQKFDGLTNSQKNAFKKWVNSRVRAGSFDLRVEDFATAVPELMQHAMTYADEWQSLMDTYMHLANWKNNLLKTIKTDNVIVPAENHSHEGIVIDTGEKLVKLVNRIEFSYKNFARNKDGR